MRAQLRVAGSEGNRSAVKWIDHSYARALVGGGISHALKAKNPGASRICAL